MAKFGDTLYKGGGAFMEEGKLVHMTLNGIKRAVSKYGTFPMFQHGGMSWKMLLFISMIQQVLKQLVT